MISGAFAPGSKLPGRRELSKQFQVSQAVIQQAMDLLVEEGFLEVPARKLGTKVADHPPHLHHYKLLFPGAPSHPSHFLNSLIQRCKEVSSTSTRTFSFFFALYRHQGKDAYGELIRQVRTKRVAGLILVTSPDSFRGTPIFDEELLPRVAIALPQEAISMPKVSVDYPGFFQRSVEHLAKNGKKRIALIAPENWAEGSPMTGYFRQAMDNCGLETVELRMQYPAIWSPPATARLVELLLRTAPHNRPDGLLVADENLLEGVVRGVMASGLQTPGDLLIVSHGTDPLRYKPELRVARFGFSVNEIMARCLEILDDLAAGKTVREVTMVPLLEPAYFDELEKKELAKQGLGG